MWVSTATYGSAGLTSAEIREYLAKTNLAAYDAIRRVKDRYPEDIFPKNGTTRDCQSAEMARFTCDNIKMELDNILSEIDKE